MSCGWPRYRPWRISESSVGDRCRSRCGAGSNRLTTLPSAVQQRLADVRRDQLAAVSDGAVGDGQLHRRDGQVALADRHLDVVARLPDLIDRLRVGLQPPGRIRYQPGEVGRHRQVHRRRLSEPVLADLSSGSRCPGSAGRTSCCPAGRRRCCTTAPAPSVGPWCPGSTVVQLGNGVCEKSPRPVEDAGAVERRARPQHARVPGRGGRDRLEGRTRRLGLERLVDQGLVVLVLVELAARSWPAAGTPTGCSWGTRPSRRSRRSAGSWPRSPRCAPSPRRRCGRPGCRRRSPSARPSAAGVDRQLQRVAGLGGALHVRLADGAAGGVVVLLEQAVGAAQLSGRSCTRRRPGRPRRRR